jgi:hypothetical protein
MLPVLLERNDIQESINIKQNKQIKETSSMNTSSKEIRQKPDLLPNPSVKRKRQATLGAKSIGERPQLRVENDIEEPIMITEDDTESSKEDFYSQNIYNSSEVI